MSRFETFGRIIEFPLFHVNTAAQIERFHRCASGLIESIEGSQRLIEFPVEVTLLGRAEFAQTSKFPLREQARSGEENRESDDKPHHAIISYLHLRSKASFF